jgi:CHAT domain-containing protein
LGEPQKTLEYSQQHLALAQELKNPVNESLALLSLGQAHITLGKFRKGIALGQQGLEIARKVKNHGLESSALAVLAAYHNEVGEYQQALELGQASLAIAQALQNPRQAVEPLVVLSEVYKQLGEYSKMLEFAQQQLVATRQDRDRYGEGVALSQLGLAYFAIGNNQKAIEFAQQGLAIFQEAKSFWGQCYALIVLSNGYGALGQYEKAIATAQQSLTIAKQQKNPTLELYAFNVLASLYRKTDRIKDAISTYQEALTADSQTEASADFVAYAGLARIYRDMNSPTVAITHYKQAINGIEQIRGNIRGLPLNLQKSFLQDIQNFDRIKNADVYRELADLLISQGRIDEAQQVLELLKIQELDDLIPGKRSTNRLTELALNPVEQEIQTKYSNLIVFGQKVKNCKQDCSTLKRQLTTLREQFEAYQQTVQKALTDGTLVRIDERNKDFIASASKIVNAQPGTVLIYPLVLSDKVHLLWASQGGVLSSVTCSVGEQQLNQMIANFQDALQSPNNISAVKQHGKALYDCLIKPLKEKGEWEKNKIQNLVIAADRAINYIPIGALFDGKQFLIQRYTFSNILNAGLTDVEAKLPQNLSVLGLGITEELDDFSALPYVEPELQAIIRSKQNPQGIYPGNIFIDQTSTASAFEDNLDKYQIVHIATHGKFDPSNPNRSYLLLSTGQPGKGDRYTVTRIQLQENLKNVHLVVLSACQTASGESASNGIEIQGMSAAFVRDRAKAVIASLWNVDDASTSLLMQQFYQNLATGKMTKAEALRQAQLSLLQGKLTAKNAPQRGPTLMPIGAPPQRRSPSADFSHPYYWAPFILIGNGL